MYQLFELPLCNHKWLWHLPSFSTLLLVVANVCPVTWEF